MAEDRDQNTSSDMDDDFDFDKENAFGEAEFQDTAAPAKKQIPKGALIGGAIAGLVLVWQVIAFFNKTNQAEFNTPAPVASTETTAMPVTDATAAAATSTPVAAAAPAPEPQQVEAKAEPAHAETSMGDDLQRALSRLEKQNVDLAGRVVALENLVRQNTISTANIGRNITKMDNAIDSIQSSMENIQGQVKKMTPEAMLADAVKKTEVEDKAKITTEAPAWVVHAIIPGRVWLKDKDGNTITVTEGDKLDLYGTVLVIDANHGTVVTSSGTMLR